MEIDDWQPGVRSGGACDTPNALAHVKTLLSASETSAGGRRRYPLCREDRCVVRSGGAGRVEVDATYQLQIEDAAKVAEYRPRVFLDASVLPDSRYPPRAAGPGDGRHPYHACGVAGVCPRPVQGTLRADTGGVRRCISGDTRSNWGRTSPGGRRQTSTRPLRSQGISWLQRWYAVRRGTQALHR